MRETNEDIIITTTDLERLRPLLDLHDSPPPSFSTRSCIVRASSRQIALRPTS
jgi:hypothetical protein